MITSFKGRSGGANGLSFTEGRRVWRMRNLANLPVFSLVGLLATGGIGYTIINQNQGSGPQVVSVLTKLTAKRTQDQQAISHNQLAVALKEGAATEKSTLSTPNTYYQCYVGAQPGCNSNGAPQCYPIFQQQYQQHHTQIASSHHQVRYSMSRWALEFNPHDSNQFLCANQQQTRTQLASSGHITAPKAPPPH